MFLHLLSALARSRSLLSHTLVALTAWHSKWNDAAAQYRAALDALVAAISEHASTNHHSDGNGSISGDRIAALQWLVDQTAGLASAVRARGDRAGSVLYSVVQGSQAHSLALWFNLHMYMFCVAMTGF